jgi:hypothetical protein
MQAADGAAAFKARHTHARDLGFVSDSFVHAGFSGTYCLADEHSLQSSAQKKAKRYVKTDG